MKKSIALVNLGGIKKLLDIPVFLFNMFNDENIIPLKQPLRVFVSVMITLLRAKGTYKIYKNVKSPVFSIVLRQQEALKSRIKADVKVMFSYSKPFVEKGACLYVPLYSFYSHTTYGNILKRYKNVFPPLCIFGEFFDMTERRIRESLKNVPDIYKNQTVVLVSAHSLPAKLAQKTKDSYKNDVEVFTNYLRKRIDAPVFLSFQSKLGPIRWFEPSTAEMIGKIGKKYKALIMVPVSFINDNTETVYEMDIIYKKLAEKSSFKYFKRVECLNDSDDFLSFLSENLKKRCE